MAVELDMEVLQPVDPLDLRDRRAIDEEPRTSTPSM